MKTQVQLRSNRKVTIAIIGALIAVALSAIAIIVYRFRESANGEMSGTPKHMPVGVRSRHRDK